MRRSNLMCLAAVLAACGMEVEAGDLQEAPQAASDNVAAVGNPIVAEPSSDPVVSALLYSDRDAELAARIDGVVEAVLVELGDVVAAGAVLARLDDGREAARRQSAAAAAELAGAEHARAEALHGKGLITTAEYETSLYTLRNAEAELRAIEVELGYTRVTAPFGGVVTSRMTGIGRSVREGEPLFRVTALRPLNVLVRLTEREARSVAIGGAVRLVHDEGLTVSGRIERISPAVDPASGTVEVLVRVLDPGELRPGSVVRVHITSPEEM